ncbi:GTPase-activator protein for ras-like GTPase domain-containing protein [Ditylenchus destructor]|uniref:GTPase-activator protein for ras-like GTPase domain-containing protein n=1 Tax=Ditylenchus destructor TaxID=166010 RepID=A0AAD4NBJ4_9BILA|nr:GTPase-activator protein for ras-like GTPase domain-containing protein [Ditylenchus destructor]
MKILQRNITVYAELAFSRVVDSHQRCPGILREVFAELREVVQKYFPGRDDVARLALSSFLIMRFFAAAILNPKLFSLKRDTPDADVSRTLVLVSKILQRLANCVVSAHPLTTKEQWLSPVLLRFLDDAHKTAMINFLDGISTDNSFLNDENASPDGGNNPPSLLKHGHMIERRIGLDKKRSLKNFILKKNRYVTLTENQLSWQKAKDTPSLSSPSEMSSDDLQKGFPLSDITSVSPLPEQKHCFRVSTQTNEVHFQANTASEMNEWVILIQKQQRRQIMLLNRPSSDQSQILSSPAADVDMEREMQIIHSYFCEHSPTFEQWRHTLVQNKEAFKRQLQPISAISMIRDESPRSSNAGVVTLPLEKMFENSATTDEEREFCLSSLHETLTSVINAIQQVEQAHHSAKDVSYQMELQGMHTKHVEMCENSLHPLSPGKDQDNADFSNLIPSVISGQKLIDNENYLHLRQRKRIKTSSSSHPIPATALFLPTSTINENRKQLELSSLKTTKI